jgi:hypothetical protein
LHVLLPDLPSRIAKIAAAVTAAKQINLQHGIARGDKSPGLNRGHSAGFVHLLAKRMHVHEPAAAAGPVRRMAVDAKAIARLNREKERG